MKLRHLILGLGLPLAATAVLWFATRPSARPDVILVTVDTLRADHLGCYGYERPTSPNIDALAARGVLFELAFAQASLSGPSHATIMTSLDVPLHEAMTNGVPLDDSRLTLAEVLREAGYATAMFVSDAIVGPRMGLDQGFEVAEVHQVAAHGIEHDHRDLFPDREPFSAVFDAALRWLALPRETPYFLWLHAIHPHKSHEPPPPFDTSFMLPPESRHDLRCARTYEDLMQGELELSEQERAYSVALYDGEIAYVDRQLGRLLEWSRLDSRERNTVIVLTADHGEMLLDHPTLEITGHGRYRYDGVLHVPLIVSGAAGSRSGLRVRDLVGSIDIAPTVLDLVGIRRPRWWRGRSLTNLMRGADMEPRQAVFALTTHSDQIVRTAARTLDHKLIVDSGKAGRRTALFDLAADPLETTDLASDAAHADDLARLISLHDDWLAEVWGTRDLSVPQPTEAVREMLERAGYLRKSERSRWRREREKRESSAREPEARD